MISLTGETIGSSRDSLRANAMGASAGSLAIESAGGGESSGGALRDAGGAFAGDPESSKREPCIVYVARFHVGAHRHGRIEI